MSREIELLTEIRDLLQLVAEPAMAKRDAALRAALRSVVGSSGRKAKAVLLMDGTRAQAGIAKESGLDKSDLSKLVKGLAAAKLIPDGEKHPRLAVKVPSTFFEEDDAK